MLKEFGYIIALSLCYLPAHSQILELTKTSPKSCSAVFGYSTHTNWRLFQTVPNDKGAISPTSLQREKQIKSWVNDTMAEMNQESTMGMGVFFAEGTIESTVRANGPYGSGISAIYEVSNVPHGQLKMTMVLPVSSHAGLDNARKWAFEDVYDIILRVGGRYGQTTYLAKEIPSRDFITIQEVTVPLIPGQIVEVLYNRHGSFGPDIYAEGRIVGILWNGK